MEKNSKVLYFLVKIKVSALNTTEVDESEVDYIVSDLYIQKISIANLKWFLRRDFLSYLLYLINNGKLNTFIVEAQVTVKEGGFIF